MSRTLARAIASSLVLVVSFATVPLVNSQQPAAAQPAQAPATGSTGTQPAAPGQGSAQAAPQETNPTNHQPPVELPENPGRSNTPEPAGKAPAPVPSGQQQRPEPNGTAVAPQVATSGGAASKPAGVALAPPKQRRVRSLVIKLGILAGAGIAIGTVAGLSAASPSHVPNSPGH
jgi:hypothetical protein